MKKIMLSILALLMTTMTTSAYELTVGTSEHGTIAFTNAEGTAITTASEGDVVTVTITPDGGYIVNELEGQWYAAEALARRQAGSISTLDAIELTPGVNENTWTFTMKKANAELSAVYDKLMVSGDFVVEIAEQTYTGEQVEPAVTVKDGETTLTEGTHYTVTYPDEAVNVGIYEVIVTAIEGSGYNGTVTATFSITPAEITSCMVEYLYWKHYNGKEWRPVLRIFYNDVQLIEGRDYAVAYKNNTEATTATCVITGLGNFTGKCIKNFAIRRITLDKVTVASVDATTEKLTYGGMTLVKGKDYTVTRKDGIAYFSGEGNYFGDLEVKYGTADSGTDEAVTAPADDATAINGVESAAAEEWYTVGGVRLAAKPSKPGIYVVGGKKVVLK